MKKNLLLWMVREKDSRMVEFYSDKPIQNSKGYYVKGSRTCKWLGYLLNNILRVGHNQLYKISLTIESVES